NTASLTLAHRLKYHQILTHNEVSRELFASAGPVIESKEDIDTFIKRLSALPERPSPEAYGEKDRKCHTLVTHLHTLAKRQADADALLKQLSE
ncbi:hypothetical protein KIPB_015906, partial [Kipferlia bialata]